MDIEEVKKLKKKLEEVMAGACDDFEEQTETTICGISLRDRGAIMASDSSGNITLTSIYVKIDVGIL